MTSSNENGNRDVRDDAAPLHPGRRVIAYLALCVSILIAADWWFFLYGQTSALYVPLFGYDVSQSVGELATLAVLGIALDTVAGVRGGAHRRIGVIAGVILASPLIVLVLSSFWPDILPWASSR
jgi:hypothetical protein